MHKVNYNGILSTQNGMNIYRGCLHGCIYCDARSTCYNMNHVFEDIEVKANAPALLEKALCKKRSKCMIGTGAMSDPYIPLEKNLNLTRRCLEIIDKYGFGLSIQTKSNLIMRDLDLIKSINEKSKCVVQITMTTYDEKLCRIIEPNVCTTRERFEVLKAMKKEGIPTIVWLSPILPFINDTEENLKGIMNYCIEAGVYGVICFGMGVTLRSGDREYFYKALDKNFKGMKERYINMYGNSYELNSPANSDLMKIFKRICSENGIVSDPNECFKYMKTYEMKSSNVQMSIFDL